MARRKAQHYFNLGGLLMVGSIIGLVVLSWAHPASAQISTAFDLSGLGTRNPIEIALSLINWMLGILALIAVVLVLYGGFLWLTSRGDETKIDKAKQVLINAGIGLLIILAAWGIVLYILSVLLDATGANNVNGTTGGGYGGGFPSSGSTFYVRSTDPDDGSTGVTLCTDIYMLFSKDIDTTSTTTNILASANPTFYLRLIDSSTLVDKAAAGTACTSNADCSSSLCDTASLSCTGDNVAGTVEIDQLDAGETTDHFSFLPSTDFLENSTYEGTIVGGASGVLSEESTGALTMDQDYTFSFTTGSDTDTTPPVVDEISGDSPFPAEGETDVCLNTPINFQFSEAIRTYTVDDDTSFLVSGDSSFSSLVGLRSFDFGGDRIYAMARPSDALTENSTYNAELYGGDVDSSNVFTNVVTDTCGNPLDGNFSGAAQGAALGDSYFSPGYDATGDGTSDDPLSWETGTNAECIPLITGIDPTDEYYGYGDDGTTAVDDSDSSSVAVTGEFLSPNPEVIFNDTIYSSLSDLTCFDQELPPNEETVCFISASSSEDDTKVAVGAQDGSIEVNVADEGSECLFDADADGTVSCVFTVDSPYIDYIDQHESAPGDYATIGGQNFGSSGGSVYFRADDATVAAGYPAYVVADLPESCGDTWSESQIVIVVPNDYPVGTDLDVQVETAEGQWSNLSYFTIGSVSRPSICVITPDCNEAGAYTSVITGKKLGASGVVNYGDGVGTSSSWSSTSITATSPGDITDGTYYVNVVVDDLTSNGLAYTIPCADTSSSNNPGGNSTFYVRSTDPADSDTDVTLCTDIYAEFSDEIDISTATTSTFFLQLSGGGASGSSCTANTDCASDSCSSGACSGSHVSGTIELDSSAATDGTDHVSFLPSQDMEVDSTYLGTIVGDTGGLTASDGTALDDDYTFTFYTGSTTDTTPPTVDVSATYPPDDTADVCLYTAISYGFSEAMRTYTFDDNTSVLVSNSTSFPAASLVDLHSFTFGADRDTATTRVFDALDADTEYYTRLYGGDLQSDGSYDNVVTDACGNPLDGDVDGTAEGAPTDSYFPSSNPDDPLNWTTGETAECSPVITSISPTSGYYGVEGLTTDYMTISGQYLAPTPDVKFYNTIYASDGELACFNTDTPPDVVADCFNGSAVDTEIQTKIPVGAVDGSVSVTVAGLSSSCQFTPSGSSTTSCEVTVNSPHIDSISPSDAAAGDYVTIFGSNFGASTGSVYFRSSTQDVIAELPPTSCGDTWSDTQIVVIVPSDFAVGTDVDVQVLTDNTLGGYASNLEGFTISDANRPSVCSIVEDCHDSAGQTSTITGKKFGSSGTVAYGDAAATTASWTDTSILSTAPSTLAQDTYYVAVTSSSETSNVVGYSIPCNTAPQVVEVSTCNTDDEVYPLPNPLPDETEACVNSDLEVMFDQKMDTTTLDTTNISLVSCGTGTTFSSSSCGSTNLIHSTDITTNITVVYGSSTYYGFDVAPSSSLTANTWYQVTIDTGVESSAGVALADDYVYQFKVRDSSEDCTAASIAVTPPSYTHNAYCLGSDCPRTDAIYTGHAYSEECLLLDSSSTTWNWTLTNPTGADCTADSTICEDTETCVPQSGSATSICTSYVGDFSDSGSSVYTKTGSQVTVYPAGDDNYNQGTAALDTTADGLTDDSTYSVDLGYCETDADCNQSCSGSTCDDTLNRCTPVITDFSPTSGEISTWVTINGCMFGPSKGNVQWESGSIVADTSWPDEGICGDTWSDTQIIAEVPATYGTAATALPNGSYTVNVENTYGLEDTTTTTYTVNSDVHAGLCRVSPDTQNIAGDITLSGQNFGDTESTGYVSFFPDSGTTRISSVSTDTTWTDTQIDTIVPEGAGTGLSADGFDGVKVILPSTSESNAMDFTVSYPAPTVTSSTPADGDTEICPNATLSVTFSEEMTNISVTGSSASIKLYEIVDNGDGTTTTTRKPITSYTTSGNTVTLTPKNTMDVSSRFVLILYSDSSSTLVGVNSDLNLADGTAHIYFGTAAVICTPDHVGLSMSANELSEDLDLNVDGIIQDASVEVGSWTYTEEAEARTWTARMYDENDQQLANVGDMSWSWTWEPLYDETACVNAVWIDSVVGDTDLDLLTDTEETGLGTDPNVYDTDGDSYGDGWELSLETDPLDSSSHPNALDVDHDGLLVSEETAYGTDYVTYDTDGDGYGDGWEVLNGFDPIDETSFPSVADPGDDGDDDGLLEVSTASGAQEETAAGTSSADSDSDNDTYLDGWEVLYGSDPMDATSVPDIFDPGPDGDGDGLGDIEEASAGTDGNTYDTDGDGYGDGWEVENDTDPLDEGSYPTTVETLTGDDDSQTVISGSSDGETSAVDVTATPLAGWTGSLTTSAAVSLNFCNGDSWQYSDSSKFIQLWYCDDGNNLPDLSGPATGTGTDYIYQYLFPSEDDANDTIGIRIYANSTDFLTPEEWVLENVPNAGDLSLSSAEIDGYPAVQSDNAIYIDAAFVNSLATTNRLYNNIYLITWTQGGDAETIASEILDNIQFNTNVNDSATTDAISGPDQGCVYSDKSKLQRDTERMIELQTLSTSLESYYTDNSEYPEPKSSTLDSYIHNLTTSVWPSWQGALGNVLGQALDEDPINAYIDATDENGNAVTDYFAADATNECPYSPDTNQFYDTSGTCWDNVNLTFFCPDNSYVYLYKRDDADSTNSWVYGNMEYVPSSVSARYYSTTTLFNTYRTSSTDYDPCSSSGNDCSCFNFALNSTAGASFSEGE